MKMIVDSLMFTKRENLFTFFRKVMIADRDFCL